MTFAAKISEISKLSGCFTVAEHLCSASNEITVVPAVELKSKVLDPAKVTATIKEVEPTKAMVKEPVKVMAKVPDQSKPIATT